MDEDVDNDDSSCCYDNDDWLDDEDAAELKKKLSFCSVIIFLHSLRESSSSDISWNLSGSLPRATFNPL